MKWGILATGTIAKKFAATVNQMKDTDEVLAAVGSRKKGRVCKSICRRIRNSKIL